MSTIKHLAETIASTQPIESDFFAAYLGQLDIQKPFTLCIDDHDDAPDISVVKRLVEGVEPFALLPKNWTPKHQYIEVFKGIGRNYKERIILKRDVRTYIKDGWHVSRLSKVSTSLVYKKWHNAIVAIEKDLENMEKNRILGPLDSI